MTADNHKASWQPADFDERWRCVFVLAINQLAAGRVDYLTLDDWSVRAQALHGHRNPVEVAHEEWACGRPGRPP